MVDSFEIESIPDHSTPNIDFNPKILLPRYDDFKTIDWVQENLQSHKSKSINNRHRQNLASRFDLSTFYEFFQTYIILTAVGIIIGTVAGCLNIITEYLSNIRTGYCSNALYLNRNFCCWGESNLEECEAWVEYSRFGLFNYIMFILISLAFSFTSSKLVLHYAPFAAGSGISEIKAIVSGFSMDEFLSLMTFLFKSIGLPLAIASGLSVGKEGPSVHYAVCVGSVISKLFAMKLSKSRSSRSLSYKNILVASSAAGVAVAFGSPMGGVLFSIEEISNLFKLSTMWESYYCSLIAVSFLQLLNPFRTGQVVMFEVKFDIDWHFFEIPIFVILGIFGGVYGILISKFNLKAVNFRKKYLKDQPIKEVFVLTLITALISYFNDFLQMDMTEGMEILFQSCDQHDELFPICQLDSGWQVFRALFSLFFATAIRMILIVFTYGCKVPAGIFVPSMACGATFGRALGIIMQLIRTANPDLSIFKDACQLTTTDSGSTITTNCISPGAYAFLGAAAGLSGITHLTVTVVIIMFELTGAFKYIIPTMVTVAITKSINDRYGPGHGGIADQMIEVNGLPFIHPHDGDDTLKGWLAKDAMTKKLLVFTTSGLNWGQVNSVLKKTSFQGFPIVVSKETPLLKGFATRDAILAELEDISDERLGDERTSCLFNSEISEDDSSEISFKNAVSFAPITVELDTQLDAIVAIFHKVGPAYVLVQEEGYLKGLITRKDLLKFQHYLHEREADSEERIRQRTFKYEEEAWDVIRRIDEWIMRLFKK